MNESKSKSFEYMDSEKFREIEQEMRDLLSKNWKIELETLGKGLSVSELNNSKILMQEFCRGIVDTLRDQLRRRLVPDNYALPKVIIGYAFSSYIEYQSTFHTICVSSDSLIELSRSSPFEKKVFKTTSGLVKFEGTTSDLMYQGGIEEAKHSVDFRAGKIQKVKCTLFTADIEYSSQQHEYTALGEQVLLLKKRNMRKGKAAAERFSHESTIAYLDRVIANRGKSKMKPSTRQ